MLAIIEILLAPILTFIFELFVEFIFTGILYAITSIIVRTIESTRDTIESVADDAAKTPEKRAVIIFFLIMSGFMAGVIISAISPERIIKIDSITGISLLITPLILGMVTSYVCRFEKERDQGPSILTTFLGGALFGLTAALTRLLFIIQKQA